MKPEATKEDFERAREIVEEYYNVPGEEDCEFDDIRDSVPKSIISDIMRALAEVRAEKVQWPSREQIEDWAFDYCELETLEFADHPAPWKRAGYMGFLEGIETIQDWIKANTKGVEG